MAAKHGSKRDNSWEVEFVVLTLTQHDKERLNAGEMTAEQAMSILEGMIEDGYKISINADKSHNCVGVWATEPWTKEGARRKCLSARGPEYLSAIRALAYKHHVLLEGQWRNVDVFEPSDDSWG